MKIRITYQRLGLHLAILCSLYCGNRVGASPAAPHPDATGSPARPSAFSPYPTDSEIFQARLFDEPIIPVGREVKPEENEALAEALTGYGYHTNSDDFSSLTSFLETHPVSRWRGSLLLHLGTEYYTRGYYSRALATWEEAWKWWEPLHDHKSKPQADRALGEIGRASCRERV